MMSEAEEMLLATTARGCNASDTDVDRAGPSMLDHSGNDSAVTVPVEVAQTPSKPSSPAHCSAHEGDHVRNARLSTSDARKADHEISSRIVALSSSLVADADPLPKSFVQFSC